MAGLETFQPVEIMGLALYNSKGEFAGVIEYMDDLNLDMSATKQELRSGVGNAVIYSISSEFTSALTGNCVMCTDLFKAYTGGDPYTGNLSFTKVEEIQSTGTSASVSETPASGGKFDIWVLDANGKRDVKLSSGTPSSTATAYSISGKTITIHNSHSGKKLKVIYEYQKTGTRFRKYNVDTDTYKAIGMGKAVDLTSPTKEKKIGQFIIPSFKITNTFQIGMSNADFTKAAIEGECLAVQDGNRTFSWDFIVEE